MTVLDSPPPAASPSDPQRSRFVRPARNGATGIVTFDEVTGLRGQRALWRELAQRAVSCSESSPLAVLVLDFDRLGEVNERYDRSVGDAVLRRCAEVAGDQAPSPQLAFRYRDDELVLLVPGDEEDGREVAERVRERIAAQNSHLPAITVSCGVAVIRDPVEPIVALGKVGPALQAAKRAGGNRVVLTTELGRKARKGDDGGDGTARRAALAMAVASLQARDRATAAHSDDVVTLCESIGERLGLSDEQLERLAAAAQLHDVGKLAMPTEILNKPGPLDDDEWSVIREHTVIGERMLRAVPEMGAVANMVRHSHESWDGTGYPDGLAGDEIPLASRVILCADAFHAIRSDRPYRPGCSADEALSEVRSCAGKQFDPRVVDALVAVARDVRRATRMGTALPRPRRLAALLAALAVGGGGTAFAASEDVRDAFGKVVNVVVPGTVLAPADANASDFSLRPIDQVPEIAPVAAITPDPEFPALQAHYAPPDRAQGDIGESAIAFLAEGGGFAEHGIEHKATAEAPQASSPPAPDAAEPELSVSVGVEPDSSVPLALTPVADLVPSEEPESANGDKGNPHGAPPAVGNPHGAPPAVGNPHGVGNPHDVDEVVNEVPVPEDEPDEDVDEIQPVDTPQLPPATTVVAPAPSIVVPDENVFAPALPVLDPVAIAPTPVSVVFDPSASASGIPATRPPEYEAAPVTTETPTTD